MKKLAPISLNIKRCQFEGKNGELWLEMLLKSLYMEIEVDNRA